MQGDILFDAVLEPNPPLGSRGVMAVLGAVALISFCAGLMFLLQGAWPVTPFFGADVALLGWAFAATQRASRRRERLLVSHDRVIVERLMPDGRKSSEELNPYWLRVDHDDPEQVGAELALVLRGRRCVIGSFLGAAERASLAAALREALQQARNAPAGIGPPA
jgi:uncharacterized membrane protein